jgi:predicted transcriptional regulator
LGKLVLLSIHPQFVEKILLGEKRVELRRRKPRIDTGDAVLIYSTNPVGKLAGMACVDSVVTLSVSSLWSQVRGCAGVSRSDFDTYFSGLEQGIGIFLTDTIRFRKPIPLWRLRQLWPGFHPPQSFRYFDWQQVAMLRIPEIAPTLARRAG